MHKRHENPNEIKANMKRTAKKAEFMGKELANDVKYNFKSVLGFAEEKMDDAKEKMEDMKHKIMK